MHDSKEDNHSSNKGKSAATGAGVAGVQAWLVQLNIIMIKEENHSDRNTSREQHHDNEMTVIEMMKRPMIIMNMIKSLAKVRKLPL